MTMYGTVQCSRRRVEPHRYHYTNVRVCSFFFFLGSLLLLATWVVVTTMVVMNAPDEQRFSWRSRFATRRLIRIRRREQESHRHGSRSSSRSSKSNNKNPDSRQWWWPVSRNHQAVIPAKNRFLSTHSSYEPIGPPIYGPGAGAALGLAVAMNGDGTIVAHAGNDYFEVFRLVQDSNGTQQWSRMGNGIGFPDSGSEVNTRVALSSNGLYLVTASAMHGNDTGLVAVWEYYPAYNTWNQRGVAYTGMTPGDQFGHAVAISDDGVWLAVGAPQVNLGRGEVYMFYYDGTNYGGFLAVVADHLVIANNNNNGTTTTHLLDNTVRSFGHDVALSSDGSRLVVGAPSVNSMVDPGQVFVLDRTTDSVTGNTVYVLVDAPIVGEGAGDGFGRSVAANGDASIFASGASNNDGNGDSSGSVRVYQKAPGDATAFVQLGSDLDGDDLGDSFGWSVALSHDGYTLAVTAVYHDGNNGGQDHGQVQVLRYNGTDWYPTAIGNNNNSSSAGTTTDMDGETAGDYLGWTVAMSEAGDRIVVGAPRQDSVASFNGAAYVYGDVASTPSPSVAPNNVVVASLGDANTTISREEEQQQDQQPQKVSTTSSVGIPIVGAFVGLMHAIPIGVGLVVSLLIDGNNGPEDGGVRP